MMCYSVQTREICKFVNCYLFLPFAKSMLKILAKI